MLNMWAKLSGRFNPSKIIGLRRRVGKWLHGPRLKTPTGGGDPVGVVEYDRQLGGGVPPVKSEGRWEEECAVSEYVTLYRAGRFIGTSRQQLAKAASKASSFDALDIV
jgi:hypothetical protein